MTLATHAPEAVTSAPVIAEATSIIDTPEDVKDYLIGLARHSHMRAFVAANNRLPHEHENKGRFIGLVALAFDAYMLRPDETLARRLDIAAQRLARYVANAIERAQAKDSLS